MWLVMLMLVAAYGPLSWSFPVWLWAIVLTYAIAPAPPSLKNVNDSLITPNTRLETFQEAYDRNFHGFRDRITKGR